MRSDWTVGLILLLGLVGLQTPPPPKPLPRFEDYRVDDVFKGPPAAVLTTGSKLARTFRTRLREGAAKGPNFAGRFTLVSWGCGASCQDWAVVDARTGQVSESMIRTSVGAEFRLDSRLLLVDTPRLAAEMFGGKVPASCADCGTPGAYEWRDGQWQAVAGFGTSHPHRSSNPVPAVRCGGRNGPPARLSDTGGETPAIRRRSAAARSARRA